MFRRRPSRSDHRNQCSRSLRSPEAPSPAGGLRFRHDESRGSDHRCRRRPLRRLGIRQRPCPRVPFVVGPGGARPDGDRRRQGLPDVGRQGHDVPRLLVPAGQRQHRPPAPADDRGHQAAGRPLVHGRPEHGQRHAQRGRQADRRAGAGRRSTWCSSPTVGRKRSRTPPVWPRSTPVGIKVLSIVSQLPRQHNGCDQPDRRAAPVGQRAGHAGGRQVLRPVPLSLRVRRNHRAGGVRAGARPSALA